MSNRALKVRILWSQSGSLLQFIALETIDSRHVGFIHHDESQSMAGFIGNSFLHSFIHPFIHPFIHSYSFIGPHRRLSVFFSRLQIPTESQSRGLTPRRRRRVSRRRPGGLTSESQAPRAQSERDQQLSESLVCYYYSGRQLRGNKL